jgi:hypothetical protein
MYEVTKVLKSNKIKQSIIKLGFFALIDEETKYD